MKFEKININIIISGLIYVILLSLVIVIIDKTYPLNQPEFRITYSQYSDNSTFVTCNFNEIEVKYFAWCKLFQDEDFIFKVIEETAKLNKNGI